MKFYQKLISEYLNYLDLLKLITCDFYLQDRLQRCALECQDKIRDKVTPSTTEADMIKYRGEMEGCVRQCADTYVNLIPNLMKKMKETLGQKSS
jgi:hypothetical protein